MPLPIMLEIAAANLDSALHAGVRSADSAGDADAGEAQGVPQPAGRAEKTEGTGGRNAGSARGKASRRKGAKGQSEFAAMLRDHDWTCDQITSGIAAADMIGTDPAGKTWCVEIKNTASILPAHRRQAMEQAKKRRLPWMLASKIAGTGSWLIQRQGRAPIVWHTKDSVTID